MVTRDELYEQYLIDLKMIREKYQYTDDDEYLKADTERKELKRSYNEDLSLAEEEGLE